MLIRRVCGLQYTKDVCRKLGSSRARSGNGVSRDILHDEGATSRALLNGRSIGTAMQLGMLKQPKVGAILGGFLAKQPVSWGSLALLVLTGGGLLTYFNVEKQRRIQEVRKDKSVGKAAIGGPFSLVDQDGKTVTPEDFKGSWNLFYFGFTYCPDICPAELEKLAKAVDLIEKKGGIKVRPVFISVDPERDTVEQVKQYVREFHPKMVGLTGTVEAVRDAARAYRVYYMKTEEEGSDYLVDHSIIIYLMDPNMDFVKFFGKNNTAEALTEGVIEEIRNWKKP
eukprot:jgi/Mesen1/2681/ME000167S01832